MNKKATTGRIILLVIIFIAIWFLLINKFETETIQITQIIEKEQLEQETSNIPTTNKVILETENSQTISSSGQQNQIITNTFINDLEEKGAIIVKNNGKYYEVKSGSFILENRVVEIGEDSKTVQFLNKPRRIISSN